MINIHPDLSTRYYNRLWAQAKSNILTASLLDITTGVCSRKKKMAEIGKWSIDKLDSSNWMTWKFQIKHLMLVKDLWRLVDRMEVLQNDASAQQ